MSQVTGVLVRLDDVCGLTPSLEMVWKVLEENGVPVHLQVIPARLKSEDAASLAQRAARSRVPVAVHQHGFQHINHGTAERRYEFGDGRTRNQQLVDVEQGRDALTQLVPQLFEPIFSPPWNRCNPTTLEVLAEAGFLAVSFLEQQSSPRHDSLARVPMTTDPITWRPEPVHRPWVETRDDLLAALDRSGLAGLELHHELMGATEAAGLAGVLEELARRDLPWPTMRAVAEAGDR